MKRRLEERLPLIALIKSTKNSQEWIQEFEKLNKTISQAEFYQAKEIFVSLKDGNQAIIQQKQYSCLDNNQLFYVGNWDSLRSLYSLIDNLGKLLNINKLTKELHLVLLEDFNICLEWLKEQGYDISLIPEKYLPIIDKNILESLSDNSQDETEDTRTDIQKIRDEETGRLGEKFVYEKLKIIYKEKYSASEEDIEDTELVFKFKNIEVIWNNKNGESYENHDLKIVKQCKYIKNNKLINTREYFIEVKSTTTGESEGGNIPFRLSSNEWKLMCNLDTSYYIARVFNTKNDSPDMKLIKLEEKELKLMCLELL